VPALAVRALRLDLFHHVARSAVFAVVVDQMHSHLIGPFDAAFLELLDRVNAIDDVGIEIAKPH